MFDGVLGEQRLDVFPGTQKLKGRLNDAVEEKGEVHEQREARDLQPLESLPAEAERHNPDEERAACVDGGA